MNIMTLIDYAINNYQTLLLIAASVIASASLIIKSIENLVVMIATLWPAAAKAEGPLNSVLDFLSKLAANPILNHVALSPSKSALVAQ